MEFQDKNLNCVDCGTEFLWTAGEQLFFADKNFKNEPKRCKSCKAKRASRPAGAAGTARERVETTTNCSACGKETTVPFRPTQDRPVRPPRLQSRFHRFFAIMFFTPSPSLTAHRIGAAALLFSVATAGCGNGQPEGGAAAAAPPPSAVK